MIPTAPESPLHSLARRGGLVTGCCRRGIPNASTGGARRHAPLRSPAASGPAPVLATPARRAALPRPPLHSLAPLRRRWRFRGGSTRRRGREQAQEPGKEWPARRGSGRGVGGGQAAEEFIFVLLHRISVDSFSSSPLGSRRSRATWL